MDWLQILEQYGVPLVVATAFWIFIQKRVAFIEKELMEDLEERFKRLEGILIKLIDQQKKMQIEQKGIEKSYKALVEIIATLAGGGMKQKFLSMIKSNEDD